MRHPFENNDSSDGITDEEAVKIGLKVHMILPILTDGHHYELMKLTNGKTALVVEKN